MLLLEALVGAELIFASLGLFELLLLPPFFSLLLDLLVPKFHVKQKRISRLGLLPKSLDLWRLAWLLAPSAPGRYGRGLGLVLYDPGKVR